MNRSIVIINDTHVYITKNTFGFCVWLYKLWWNFRQLFVYAVDSTGHRVALVEVGSVGADPARLLSGTRATEIGWTVLFPPMLKLSICCRSRVATCALAPLFVTKMHVRNALRLNQNANWYSNKTIVTVCKTMIRTKEKLRVKNGILLTMNPTEHTGWIIVDAGRLM